MSVVTGILLELPLFWRWSVPTWDWN